MSTPVHLLAAEDDALGRRLLQVFLHDRLGYALDVVDNGVAALTAIGQTVYDAALLDLEMPKMGGMALIREIRKQEQSSGRPRLGVIALTGHAGAAAQQACLDLGFDGFISKPIRLADMQLELERVLNVNTEQRQLQAAASSPGADIAGQVWAMLEPIGVDAATMAMLVRIFKDNHGQDVLELAEGLSQGNAEQTRLYAHKLKGSLATLCANDLAAMMLELERRAETCRSAEDFVPLVLVFDRFSMGLTEFNARLDIWLDSMGGKTA